MIDAAEQMKTILGQMTAEISAEDYLNTMKFLDQLAAEARGRIETGKAAPSSPPSSMTDGDGGGFRDEILHCRESLGENLLRPLCPP